MNTENGDFRKVKIEKNVQKIDFMLHSEIQTIEMQYKPRYGHMNQIIDTKTQFRNTTLWLMLQFTNPSKSHS